MKIKEINYSLDIIYLSLFVFTQLLELVASAGDSNCFSSINWRWNDFESKGKKVKFLCEKLRAGEGWKEEKFLANQSCENKNMENRYQNYWQNIN